MKREDDFALPFAVPFSPWELSFSFERGAPVPTPSANARVYTFSSKPRAHAMEFVEVQKWERSVCVFACVCVGGLCWLWGYLPCVSLCLLQLGTPSG